jgi:hypothetical protein
VSFAPADGACSSDSTGHGRCRRALAERLDGPFDLARLLVDAFTGHARAMTASLRERQLVDWERAIAIVAMP